MNVTPRSLLWGIFAMLLNLWGGNALATEPAVILITLDGVRTEEVTRSFLPETFAYVKDRGFLLGRSADGIDGGGSMRISNRAAVSLPGYRALLQGRFESACRTNDCGQIRERTLFDDLPELGINPADAVVFASWNRVGRAVTSGAAPLPGSIEFGAFHSNTATPALRDDLERILADARATRPDWKNSRWDQHTWDLALRYLDEVEPRLTYLSFVDSDEWAHLGNRREYHASLRTFDRRFRELRDLLARTPGRLERTSFVITTDHGRGRGWLWRHHQSYILHARRTFAFVIPSEDLRRRRTHTPRARGRQSQVRATVEELLAPGSELWKRQGRKGSLFSSAD